MFSFIPKAFKRVLILFHGYGSNGEDMLGLARELGLDDTAYICPNGPIDLGFNGYSWFPIEDINLAQLSLNDRNELTKRAFNNISSIKALIQDITSKYNVQANEIMLGGFSQGGLIAILSGVQIAGLEAVIGMSAIPLGEVEIVNKPQVLLTHGDCDPIIPQKEMEQNLEMLQSYGISVQRLIVNGLGHGVNQKCLYTINNFLK